MCTGSLAASLGTLLLCADGMQQAFASTKTSLCALAFLVPNLCLSRTTRTCSYPSPAWETWPCDTAYISWNSYSREFNTQCCSYRCEPTTLNSQLSAQIAGDFADVQASIDTLQDQTDPLAIVVHQCERAVSQRALDLLIAQCGGPAWGKTVVTVLTSQEYERQLLSSVEAGYKSYRKLFLVGIFRLSPFLDRSHAGFLCDPHSDSFLTNTLKLCTANFFCGPLQTISSLTLKKLGKLRKKILLCNKSKGRC